MNQDCDLTTKAEVNNNLIVVNDDPNYHVIERKKEAHAKLTFTNIPNDYEILGLEDIISLIRSFSKGNHSQDLYHPKSSNFPRFNNPLLTLQLLQ